MYAMLQLIGTRGFSTQLVADEEGQGDSGFGPADTSLGDRTNNGHVLCFIV